MSYMVEKNINVKVVRSSRRTMSMEITKDAEVVIRAPYAMPESEIERFLKEKSSWIEKNVEIVKRKAKQQKAQGPLSNEQIQELVEKALKVIPERVAYYAQIIGVTYGRITIRNQKTRWGSCSSKGNLNFNCMLMQLPMEIIDYVVVHELCHRLEMNHSKRFWAEVEKVLPDYRERRKWLKENAGLP